jgi:hypothetical protein
MKVTTVRLPDDLAEAVANAAEESERSQSEYVRHVLRSRIDGEPNTSGDGPEPDRLAALESRIEALENGGGHLEAPDPPEAAEIDVATPESPPAVGPKSIDARVIDAMDIPQTQDPEECLAAVLGARDYLEQHGPVSMREITKAVMPEYSLGYEVPELEEGDRFRGAWWRRILQPGLSEHPDVQYRANYADYDVPASR